MAIWTIVGVLKRTSSAHHVRRCMSSITRIEKLLIANRGEIACRIIRTANRLGIQTVAVYSDADKSAMHVAMADEAYNIGPASSQHSYLCGDKIISVAKESFCQAVHPGYGFLSESTEFATLCQAENVIFVGPPAAAIRDMGIKSTSKKIMAEAGVPIIEGYHGDDQTIERLQAEAKRIGFPIMIKAIRGGGGKGMRIAYTESEFLPGLESAKNESMKAFGDDNVLLERYIEDPRHVEVQVFADTHGQTVHLFERDCSVQRRHQKIIEEAPAPGISSKLRAELGAAAVQAAKAVNYVGAGTVEFILDRDSHSFHFMEMNTRLQVEHPITEMITGTDLVEWQLKIAAGEKLPLTQEQIKMSGHAFEGRIYAEDPNADFLPRPGPLLHLSAPTPSAGVRVETGVRQGDEVSVHYDPMIAKLAVWGKSREEALSKLAASLADYNIAGVDTNVNFLIDLCRHPQFLAGDIHTGFIEENRNSLFVPRIPSQPLIAKLALATILYERHMQLKEAKRENEENNPFVIESGFRVNHDLVRTIRYVYDDTEHIMIKTRYIDPDNYQVRINDQTEWVNMNGLLEQKGNVLDLKCRYDGNISTCRIAVLGADIYIFDQFGKWKFTKEMIGHHVEEPAQATPHPEHHVHGAMSPMPGIVEKIYVKPGDTVKKGDPLFVVTAMKMEHVVKATHDGRVASVFFKVGETVNKNAVIVDFESDDEYHVIYE